MTPTHAASPARVGRNTVQLLGSEVIQLLGMLVVLFGVDNGLDGVAFGRYSGGLAVATILATASRLGAQVMIVRAPSVDESIASQWQRSIGIMIPAGAIGLVAMIALRPLLMPGLTIVQATGLLLMQTFGFMLSELSVSVGTAIRNSTYGLVVRTLYAVGRIIGLGIFLALEPESLTAAVFWIGACGVAAGLVGVIWTARALEVSPRPQRPRQSDVRRGSGFMTNDLAQGLLVSIDRPLLDRGGYTVDSGNYALGYRIAQMAGLPPLAFLRVVDVDFFNAGKESPEALRRVLFRFTAIGMGLGLIPAAAVFFSADLLSVILGDRFAVIEPMVRWLSLLPVLITFQSMPANALSASDRQSTRNALLIAAAVGNIVMNLALIPDHGWKGAAIATLTVEFAHGILLWIAALGPTPGRAATEKIGTSE